MGVKRVAIIGAGAMAREHIRAAKSLPEVEITGIYSRTRDKAEALAKEFSIAKVANNIVELEADFVIITVSVAAVADVIRECGKKSWKILAEKPVALNFKEALKLEKDLGAKAKDISVAFNRRYYSSSQNALVELNKSDSRRIVEITDQQSYKLAAELGHPKEVVENWMYANSVHLIDMANYFCRGEVKKVSNLTNNEDFVLSHIQYNSGDEATYRCYLKQPAPWIVTITNENARYEMRPIEKLFVQRAGERVLNEIQQNNADQEYKPGFVKQMEDFLAGKGISFAESNRTMQLINQIYNK